MITSFGFIFPDASSLQAADAIPTSELPSSQYMNSEGYIFNRGSAITRGNSISLYGESLNWDIAGGDDWTDPWFPGGGSTPGNNVGAPIGDVTPLVVILLILGYTIFRSVSVSKRKNL